MYKVIGIFAGKRIRRAIRKMALIGVSEDVLFKSRNESLRGRSIYMVLGERSPDFAESLLRNFETEAL